MQPYIVSDKAIDIFLQRYITELHRVSQSLGINFNTSRSFAVIKRYLKQHPTSICFYDISLYKAMLPWALKMEQAISARGGSISVFCAIATHVHAFTPKMPFLALTFSWEVNNIESIRFKLEPYVGENGKLELCQGVNAIQNLQVNAFSYKVFYNLIDSAGVFSAINLSPSNLYSFYLATRLKLGVYDTTRQFYNEDIESLQAFFQNLQRSHNVSILLKNGIPITKLANAQQLSLQLEKENVKFPHISSLVRYL